MKDPKHIQEADMIGRESYALMHYFLLPPDASPQRQIEALQSDQHWQQLHHDEVSHRIDRLIRDIAEQEERRIAALPTVKDDLLDTCVNCGCGSLPLTNGVCPLCREEKETP